MWEELQSVIDRGHHVGFEFHLKSEAGYPRGWIARLNHLVVAAGRPTLPNAVEVLLEYVRTSTKSPSVP